MRRRLHQQRLPRRGAAMRGHRRRPPPRRQLRRRTRRRQRGAQDKAPSRRSCTRRAACSTRPSRRRPRAPRAATARWAPAATPPSSLPTTASTDRRTHGHLGARAHHHRSGSMQQTHCANPGPRDPSAKPQRRPIDHRCSSQQMQLQDRAHRWASGYHPAPQTDQTGLGYELSGSNAGPTIATRLSTTSVWSKTAAIAHTCDHPAATASHPYSWMS
mmetsp:Transcript_25878/g.86104  ORF Transcript_25878/g.86104 Transcript_25878/m.86104 type:complete len:216 (+) Transcript_25878:329-976(+)